MKVACPECGLTVEMRITGKGFGYKMTGPMEKQCKHRPEPPPKRFNCKHLNDAVSLRWNTLKYGPS